MKKRKKIILIIVGIIATLFLIFGIALPHYTEYKIREVLEEDTNFPYKISFDDFKMNVFKGDASLLNIKIIPDQGNKKEESITIKKAQIETLNLSGFNYIKLYFENTIYAESICIVEPKFNLIQRKNKKNEKNESKSFRLALDNKIHIQNIRIENANVHLSAENSETPKLHLFKFNFNIENIKINEETLKNKLPFTYEKYHVAYDSIYYKFNSLYHLQSNEAHLDNERLSIRNFEMKINDSMPVIQQKLKWQKSIFDIENGIINAAGIDWKFKGDRFQIYLKELVLKDMNTRIYKYLNLPKKETSSIFYSQELRELPFDLTVDSLKVENNKLAYVEQESFKKPKRSIRFDKLNITATDIAGGEFITDQTHTKLLINTLFMDSAKTNINWSFKPANTTDAFTFKGKIENLEADKFNPFLVSLARTKLTGNFRNIDFNLKGDNKLCRGNMILTYNDLHISILQKNKKKENHFFTSIANLFVSSKKTETEAEQADIKKNRDKNQSFFSFILSSLLDGIKETFL